MDTVTVTMVTSTLTVLGTQIAASPTPTSTLGGDTKVQHTQSLSSAAQLERQGQQTRAVGVAAKAGV